MMIDLRLANIAGLDTKDPQHSVAIKEALFGIEDTEAFLEYCRDHKNLIEYQTKTERLDTLATRYKKIQADAKLPHELANSFSKNLAHKVEQVRIFMRNRLEEGKDTPLNKIFIDGNRFFTDKEVNALSEFGSIFALIDLSENGELEDRLIDLFIGKFVAKAKYQQLGSGQKKVLKMIGGVAK